MTLRSRAGIIEVDASSHQKRVPLDASKSDLLTDGGLVLVYRIAAEETSTPNVLKGHLDTFVARLLAR